MLLVHRQDQLQPAIITHQSAQACRERLMCNTEVQVLPQGAFNTSLGYTRRSSLAPKIAQLVRHLATNASPAIQFKALHLHQHLRQATAAPTHPLGLEMGAHAASTWAHVLQMFCAQEGTLCRDSGHCKSAITSSASLMGLPEYPISGPDLSPCTVCTCLRLWLSSQQVATQRCTR